MKIPEYKVEIPKDWTLEQIHSAVEKGAKFVVFPYCFSIIFAVSMSRFSPAFLVRSAEEIAQKRNKYIRLSVFFGWWFIPSGPIRTLRYIKQNRNGGIDVTKDVLHNLNEESLKNGVVKLLEMHEIFLKPTKTDKREFLKAVQKLRGISIPAEIYVGLFVNTEEYIEPYYFIGIDTLQSISSFNHVQKEVEQAIYSRFRKHVPFEFIDLKAPENVSISEKLREQGVRIY